MLDGWIKSYRQILGWQHFQEPIVLQVWITILHSVSSKDSWLRGRRIRRGEWVTSTAQIMAICGIGSNNTVIDALNTLEESGEIKRERFGNATKITVCHFSKFQGCADTAQPTAQPTAQLTAQPTAQPTAHKQEYKEDKKLINQENINSHTPRTREEKYDSLNANDVAFADFYRKTFKTEFLWQENTSEAVQRIADSIADKISEGGGESDPAEMPDNITKFLEAVYRLGDQWLNERFTPSLLAKQFNQLYQRIISATNGNKRTGNNKRGGNAPNPYGVSDEFLEDLARQLRGGV